MNYKRFTRKDGTLDCYVNLDQVIAAYPSENGESMTLQTPSAAVTVDAGQFEKAIAEQPADALHTIVGRLIQAIEKLSVRIPTSIRLHI